MKGNNKLKIRQVATAINFSLILYIIESFLIFVRQPVGFFCLLVINKVFYTKEKPIYVVHVYVTLHFQDALLKK